MNPSTITIQSGQTLSGLAQQHGTTTQELLRLNPSISNPDRIQVGASLNLPGQQAPAPISAPSNIQNPVPAQSLNQGATAPGLPQPQAPSVQEQYVTSIATNVDNARQQLENTYSTRKAEVDREIERLRKEEDRLLKQAEPLTRAFREELENKERERLYITENFEANQALTRELDTLLTEGNNLIRYQQGLPANQRVIDARTNKAVQDVAARAGVIQAVMSARNNQIAQAYNLIDRSVAAINADRQDRLSYYDTLLNLNNQKILTLDKESKEIAEEQVNLVKGDLERAEKVADYIKGLMVSPESAQFMANAGITLNDSIEEINEKMAKQAQREKVNEFKNSLTSEGYRPATSATPGAVAYFVGDEIIYFRPPAGESVGGGRSGDGAGASLANRNRNPLNLRDPRTGEFMVFASDDDGFRAAEADLLGKMSGNTSTGLNANSTLTELINVWAPPSDGNYHNNNYVAYVAGQLGITGNTKIGTLQGRVGELARAMATFEGWRPQTVSPLTQGIVSGIGELSDLSQDDRARVIEEMTLSGLQPGQKQEAERLNDHLFVMEEQMARVTSALSNQWGMHASSGKMQATPLGVGQLRKDDFLTEMAFIIDNLTFDKLISLKGQGATFGALSDHELRQIGNSASVLAAMAKRENGGLVGFKGSKDKLEREIRFILSKLEQGIKGTKQKLNTISSSYSLSDPEYGQMSNILGY